ncbi:MAG TPA: TetR family transcriptional regulator, partial [Spirochaetia bacterium]|nr:TetR family transcriptional regulator [Spirochaetia bacterium]
MDDYQPKAPRERILAATLDLIEKQGPRQATTRSIAAAAGVNVAAINYYYRSKEALLEAALASSWEHALAHLREFLGRE